MRKRKNKRSKTAVFLTSMIFTLLFCLLVTGFIVVDINTGKTGFAGKTFDPASPATQPKSPNFPLSLDPLLSKETQEIMSKAYIAVPAPLRLITQGIMSLKDYAPEIPKLIKSYF